MFERKVYKTMSREKQINTPTHTPTQDQFTDDELLEIGEMSAMIFAGRRCQLSYVDIAKYLYEAGYHKQSAWISIEERLPNLDPYGKGRYGGLRSVRVLCVCKQRDGKTFVKEGYCETHSGAIVWRIPGSIDSVTHWMPLPEAPKGGE